MGTLAPIKEVKGLARILVVGGSGFVGRHVIPALIRRGDDVVALARSTQASALVGRLGAEPISGDLDSVDSVIRAFRSSRATVLVSIVDMGVGYVPALILAAEAAGIRRAVFVSSASIETRLEARARPARMDAELRVRASSLDWTVLRPTMIYGRPDDRNMGRLLRVLLKTPVLPVPGNGRYLQQPVHVEDVADVIADCIRVQCTVGKTYPIGGPAPMTLDAVIGLASRAVKKRPVVIHVPVAPTIALARIYGKFVPRPAVTVEQIERLQEDKSVSIDDAIADLGFRPRSFREGIRQEAALMR